MLLVFNEIPDEFKKNAFEVNLISLNIFLYSFGIKNIKMIILQ